MTDLHEALARDEADAVIAIGGTGGGRDDESVRTLARLGRVEAHGIAVSPGETAAFGFAGGGRCCCCPAGSMPLSRSGF